MVERKNKRDEVAFRYFQEMALERALNSLHEIYAALKREPENAIFRDAGIRRFEVAFYLTIRWLTRELRSTHPNADKWGHKRTINDSVAAGLLDNLETWERYRILLERARERADENVHAKVVDSIPDFAEDVRKLLKPPATRPRDQHDVAEHKRRGTWVNDFVKSDGTLVAGHYRDCSQVREHSRSNPR